VFARDQDKSASFLPPMTTSPHVITALRVRLCDLSGRARQ
jgi:hypothetical protein